MTIAIADNPADQADSVGSEKQSWVALRYFNLYRLILSGSFASLFFSGSGPALFGEHNTGLFAVTALFYLACVLISGFAHRWHRPALHIQIRFNVLIDIIAITLMMHASGGVESGLGMLLLVSLAGGGLLMSGRAILFFAAVGTLFMLAEQVYTTLLESSVDSAYTQTGILGATFFATALLANVLAHRVRATEALATQRGIDLANMEQLNAYIIQHLQSGILVVDNDERVRLMNESAWYLLGMPTLDKQQHLSGASPLLAAHLSAWRQDHSIEPPPFRVTPTGADLLARFTRLGSEHQAGSVIFLEDSATLAQQAQQMKLASLGRLTASIAHEIRNPLGAISHAGQLLNESPELNSGDRRLTEIIHEQALRVNTIIENILQLSRRERSRPQDLTLLPWLENFVTEFCRDLHLAPDSISIDINPPDVEVRMDPGHLHQVLWNLCENAVRHGGMSAAGMRIILRGGLGSESRNALLDVIDEGGGIGSEDALQIFEPFFTTNRQGTGLGLYIARELCEFNKAQLRHVPQPGGGCCFRISFMNTRRQAMSA